jgi:hypothetical protein
MSENQIRQAPFSICWIWCGCSFAIIYVGDPFHRQVCPLLAMRTPSSTSASRYLSSALPQLGCETQLHSTDINCPCPNSGVDSPQTLDDVFSRDQYNNHTQKHIIRSHMISTAMGSPCARLYRSTSAPSSPSNLSKHSCARDNLLKPSYQTSLSPIPQLLSNVPPFNPRFQCQNDTFSAHHCLSHSRSAPSPTVPLFLHSTVSNSDSHAEDFTLVASAYSLKFPPSHLLNPLFVNNYCLGDELGAGEFGFVMTARDRNLGHEVAVKFIRKAKVRNHGWVEDEYMGRVPIEVVLLSYLEHNNIVKCYDIFEDDLYFYLVRSRRHLTHISHY